MAGHSLGAAVERTAMVGAKPRAEEARERAMDKERRQMQHGLCANLHLARR